MELCAVLLAVVVCGKSDTKPFTRSYDLLMFIDFCLFYSFKQNRESTKV